MASDDPTFQARMAEVMVEQIRFDVTTPATERPADWPPTRYETKAVREGLARQYWTFAPR